MAHRKLLPQPGSNAPLFRAGTLVRFYDEGWRHGWVVTHGPKWVTIRTIPAIGRRSHNRRIDPKNVESV